MRDRDKVEVLLRNYRPIKSNLEIELNKEYPEYSLNSVSLIKTLGNTNTVGSLVEQYVVDKYSLDDEIIYKIQVFNIIKAAYESLTSLQKKIVKERYFEDKSYKKVSQKVHLHEHTISKRIEEEIIPALKNVGILNAWEIFQKECEFY